MCLWVKQAKVKRKNFRVLLFLSFKALSCMNLEESDYACHLFGPCSPCSLPLQAAHLCVFDVYAIMLLFV